MSSTPERSLERLEDTFREELSRFSLSLPADHVHERKAGSLSYSNGSGRLMFVFGREGDREYLEYYGHHRMGDCHGKIYDDGKHVSLPELCSFYGFNPDIPGDQELKRAEMEKEYRETWNDLEQKGLLRAGPVPGSMAVNAHLVMKREEPEG